MTNPNLVGDFPDSFVYFVVFCLDAAFLLSRGKPCFVDIFQLLAELFDLPVIVASAPYPKKVNRTTGYLFLQPDFDCPTDIIHRIFLWLF